MNSVVTEVSLPGNKRSRLATAIMSALQFAGSFTDLIVREGEPVTIDSARGTIPLSKLAPAADFVVDLKDIQQFFASYVDGIATTASATDHWAEVVVPAFRAGLPVHRSIEPADGAHLRVNIFQYMRGRTAMMVRVSAEPPPLTEMNISPTIFKAIADNSKGLLIITGPTASGKTVTALSIVQHINMHSAGGHIITVEAPIERPLKSGKCVITQREVPTDVASFGAGLEDAMRQAPDVILAGEARDRDAAECAIMGGESGAFMMVTTHGRSVVGTLRKLLALTGEKAPAMREVLAGSLIGVIRQELVPLKDGSGYVMVSDSLHSTPAVRQHIERGDWLALERLTSAKEVTADFIPLTIRLNQLVGEHKVNYDAGAAIIGRRLK